MSCQHGERGETGPSASAPERGAIVLVSAIVPHFDNASQEYVVVIDWADRPPQTERFRDYGRFHARIIALEQRLGAEEWIQDGSPTILSGGWRGPLSN